MQILIVIADSIHCKHQNNWLLYYIENGLKIAPLLLLQNFQPFIEHLSNPSSIMKLTRFSICKSVEIVPVFGLFCIKLLFYWDYWPRIIQNKLPLTVTIFELLFNLLLVFALCVSLGVNESTSKFNASMKNLNFHHNDNVKTSVWLMFENFPTTQIDNLNLFKVTKSNLKPLLVQNIQKLQNV